MPPPRFVQQPPPPVPKRSIKYSHVAPRVDTGRKRPRECHAVERQATNQAHMDFFGTPKTPIDEELQRPSVVHKAAPAAAATEAPKFKYPQPQPSPRRLSWLLNPFSQSAPNDPQVTVSEKEALVEETPVKRSATPRRSKAKEESAQRAESLSATPTAKAASPPKATPQQPKEEKVKEEEAIGTPRQSVGIFGRVSQFFVKSPRVEYVSPKTPVPETPTSFRPTTPRKSKGKAAVTPALDQPQEKPDQSASRFSFNPLNWIRTPRSFTGDPADVTATFEQAEEKCRTASVSITPVEETPVKRSATPRRSKAKEESAQRAESLSATPTAKAASPPKATPQQPKEEKVKEEEAIGTPRQSVGIFGRVSQFFVKSHRSQPPPAESGEAAAEEPKRKRRRLEDSRDATAAKHEEEEDGLLRPDDTWTVRRMKEFADSRGISLKGLKLKAAFLARILDELK